MAWLIGRSEAMADPLGAPWQQGAREAACACGYGGSEKALVVPILIDAILMAESYRGARHEITFLAELTRSVDALIRELNAAELAREWTEPVTGARESSPPRIAVIYAALAHERQVPAALLLPHSGKSKSNQLPSQAHQP